MNTTKSTKKKSYRKPTITEQDADAWIQAHVYEPTQGQERIVGALAEVATNMRLDKADRKLAREVNHLHVEALLMEENDEPNDYSDFEMQGAVARAIRRLADEGTELAERLVKKHQLSSSFKKR